MGSRAPEGPSVAQQWVTLAIALLSTLIVVLDNTVLNVAIPTILREFHTTLPSLEWVITGYALTFATLLIIGGRLGDVYGHRRVFVVGAALFMAGSLLASLSWNVASLVVGEAVIEGIGASLMLPATLAILSNTFDGRGRAMAFAAWGTVAGAAVALGPVLGGWLTSDFSWRWSFRINVIIAPLAIVGALLFMAGAQDDRRREPLDIGGATFITVGMFLLVFGLSEGGRYGWLEPIADFSVGGRVLWPGSAPVSLIPVLFVVAVAVLAVFYRWERAREREERGPLFEFGLLEHRTFRYGLLTNVVLAMGQLGFSFALALFLQQSVHLTPLRNGTWMVPYGLAILVASPFGGRVANSFGTTWVVRGGLLLQAVGLAYVAAIVSPTLSFWGLLPGLLACGAGIGCASSQLTNVVLSEIPAHKSGVASGANATVRQVGNSLGIAIIGTIMTTQTVRRAVHDIDVSPTLGRSVQARATAGVRAHGGSFQSLPGAPRVADVSLGHIVSGAVASGARGALVFATIVVLVGTGLSWLLPIGLRPSDVPGPKLAEELGSLLPVDPEAELVSGGGGPPT